MNSSILQIETILLSGPLKQLHVFQVNTSGHQHQDLGFIVDGGVELHFPSGIVSACWHGEKEMFVIDTGSFAEIYNQDNFFELDNPNAKSLQAFIGLSVLSVEFEKEEFDFLEDQSMKSVRKDRIVGAFLQFEKEKSLQLSFVDYHLDADGNPRDFWYDLAMELLIAIDRKVKIGN